MLGNAKRLGFLFKHKKPEVVVDVFIPFSKFGEFFDFYKKLTLIWTFKILKNFKFAFILYSLFFIFLKTIENIEQNHL